MDKHIFFHFLFKAQAHFAFPVKKEALLAIAAIATIAKTTGVKTFNIIFLPLKLIPIIIHQTRLPQKDCLSFTVVILMSLNTVQR